MKLSPWCECYKLKAFTIDAGHANLEVLDDVLFTKGRTELVSYPNGEEEKIYYVPSTVTTIRHSAFRSDDHLETVIFPSSIKTISTYTFHSSPKLKLVLYEGNTTFLNCHENAFIGALQAADLKIGLF